MSVWDIIGWLVVGLVAGWLAGIFMGRGGYGLIGDIVVGLIGAFIGSLLARVLSVAGPTSSEPFSWASLLFAIIGAIILIAILRALAPGRSRT